MVETSQRTVKEVVGMQPVVGGYPHRAARLQQVGDIGALHLPHRGSYLTAFQPVAHLGEPEKTVLNGNPHRTVLLDVTDADVGCIAMIAATADVPHTPLPVEGIAVDAVAHDMP